jgi:hypothetical protein
MIENSIQFYSGSAGLEVLRLSKDGIWANPDIPANEAAKLVLEAIDCNIKVMVDRAVADEREACAKACEHQPHWSACATAIRARGNDAA